MVKLEKWSCCACGTYGAVAYDETEGYFEVCHRIQTAHMASTTRCDAKAVIAKAGLNIPQESHADLPRRHTGRG